MEVLFRSKLNQWGDGFSLSNEQSYFFNTVKKFTFYPPAKNDLPRCFRLTSRALRNRLWYMCNVTQNNKGNKETSICSQMGHVGTKSESMSSQ